MFLTKKQFYSFFRIRGKIIMRILKYTKNSFSIPYSFPIYKKSFPLINSNLMFKSSHLFTSYMNVWSWRKHLSHFSKFIKDEGTIFFRGLLLFFLFDALLIDDEPLWEPIEWSLVQTWLFFIFFFAWIGENLIASRYGSYVGRDKRVWFAWYKSFQWIELWYLLSYVFAALFVIVPFYYEITYQIAFLVSWWDWYSRTFIFKFLFFLSLLSSLGIWLSLSLRWVSFTISLISISFITLSFAFLLFWQFYTSLLAYFTDPIWYQKTKFNDLVSLSHEPNKWGWGAAKRDHFTYHRVTTVFWMKNDGPFAGAFFMINLFFLLTLFFNFFFWLVLLRKSYTLKEVHYTLFIFCLSSLKQISFFFLLIFVLIFMSFILSYWRFPIELLWTLNSLSWVHHFKDFVCSFVL
uniref:hypothetical protein n=1 Tax=Bakuella subtropica TaxID=1295181 RepID=UPI0023EFE3F2|nr:hypothetical protein P4D19_mgp28 [Bakuella subtropica]WDY80873.1 hypothetical protein BKSUB_21 [Bakuella subtropica]